MVVKEIRKVVNGRFFQKFIEGKISQEEFHEGSKAVYKMVAENIAKQKERLGGSFAVAHAVPCQKSRQYMSQILGEDLFFVVLNLTKECQAARLKARHGDTLSEDNSLTKMFDKFEPAGQDEENAVNVTIDDSMSQQDVVEKVLNVIKNIE